MECSFYAEDINMPNFDEQVIKNWILKVVNLHGKTLGAISYIFCSDEYLLRMNKEYLNHDYYTDIITFNYCESEIISGDMFISMDRVKENAMEFDTKSTELYRVMIHGVLHLLGFEDHNEEEIELMRIKEEEALRML